MRLTTATIWLLLAWLLLAGASPALLHGTDRSGVIAESQSALRALAEDTGGFAMPGAQESGDLPHGGGTIRGVVTAAATGAPIPGATVRAILATANASPVTTTTDESGAFEIRGLTPGRWRVSAVRSGFLPRDSGQRGRASQGSTIELRDRAAATANVALHRGGVIAGHVFDELGDPAVGLRVQAMQFTRVENGRRLVPAGAPDLTDDTGAFRIYNLLPGDYLVSARALTQTDRVMMAARDRAGQFDVETRVTIRDDPQPPVATYFPGTPAVERAVTITLDAGSTHTGVNFPVTRVSPVLVSGTVMDSSGGIVSRPVSVSLFNEALDGGAMMMLSSPVNPGGRFTFRDVPPGSYFVTVSLAGPDGLPEGAEVPIVAGADDVTDLSVVTSPGALLTGTVVSGDATLPSLKGTTVRVTSEGGRRVALGIKPGAIVDDRFQITNLLGTFRFQLEGLPAGWTVRSIDVDGIDVTDTPVTFRSGRSQATVVLTNRIADLSGIVVSDGKPIDADVLIFPADPRKWTAWRFVRRLQADARGTFSLKGLPPHDDYLALATTYLEPDDVLNPDFLALARTRATPFSLGEGQSQRLRLTLVDRNELDGR